MLRCGWQLGVEYFDEDPAELLPDVVRMLLGRERDDMIESEIFCLYPRQCLHESGLVNQHVLISLAQCQEHPWNVFCD